MNIWQNIRSTRRRTNIFLLVGSLLITWHLGSLWSNWEYRQSLQPPKIAAAASTPCTELRPEYGPYQEASVKEPGPYCIATEFWQRRLSNGAGHSGPAPYRHLLELLASDTTIDLKNHILHSDGHSSGIYIGLEWQKQTVRSQDTPSERKVLNVTIKNGVIDLRGLGNAVIYRRSWLMHTLDEETPNGLTDYEKSHIVLENLLIKTDNMGVLLEGDGNIIRNCIIESGGTTAINMAGPNGQILNNTIILTNPFIPGSMRGTNFHETREFSQLMEERRRPKAAIALHQATGTIISGNRIEVKGKSPTRYNIYVSDASENVRIEGNTFVGTDAPATLLKGSTATLKSNVFVQPKPWWKF